MNSVVDRPINGYSLLGRGPECTGPGAGWTRDDAIYLRCIMCGDLMHSMINDDYECTCGEMFFDSGASRFGAMSGDENVLVYRKC